MSPIEFRQRFIENVSGDENLKAHPDLAESLSQFVSFDQSILTSNSVGREATHFLLLGGLPSGASPYLSFKAYSQTQLTQLYGLCDIPRTIFPLGHNGSGDPIGIQLASQAVVYLNHDNHMQLVFINSSIAQFAESLYWYQIFLKQRKRDDFIVKLRTVDLPALDEGSMWHSEAIINPDWD